MKDLYAGEAQFLAWGDGPGGPWVKFLLPDSESLEHFRGMTKAKDGKAGQLLAMKVVEVDVAEEPVQASHRKQGALETLAIRWCRDEEFLAWLGANLGKEEPMTPDAARGYILDLCRVAHRRELDEFPAARDTFMAKIRLPYMMHLDAQ